MILKDAKNVYFGSNLVKKMSYITATKIFAVAQYKSNDIIFSTEKQIYSCTFSLQNVIED